MSKLFVQFYLGLWCLFFYQTLLFQWFSFLFICCVFSSFFALCQSTLHSIWQDPEDASVERKKPWLNQYFGKVWCGCLYIAFMGHLNLKFEESWVVWSTECNDHTADICYLILWLVSWFMWSILLGCVRWDLRVYKVCWCGCRIDFVNHRTVSGWYSWVKCW